MNEGKGKQFKRFQQLARICAVQIIKNAKIENPDKMGDQSLLRLICANDGLEFGAAKLLLNVSCARKGRGSS